MLSDVYLLSYMRYLPTTKHKDSNITVFELVHSWNGLTLVKIQCLDFMLFVVG